MSRGGRVGLVPSFDLVTFEPSIKSSNVFFIAYKGLFLRFTYRLLLDGHKVVYVLLQLGLLSPVGQTDATLVTRSLPLVAMG